MTGCMDLLHIMVMKSLGFAMQTEKKIISDLVKKASQRAGSGRMRGIRSWRWCALPLLLNTGVRGLLKKCWNMLANLQKGMGMTILNHILRMENLILIIAAATGLCMKDRGLKLSILMAGS